MTTNRTSIPPPLQALPTAKEKKYDRQLRLWGASGQQALEDTHVLLINSGPGVTGVETLKNLVLPGIGRFTILDSAVVTAPDLGVNFFLDHGALGGSRAEHTCALLKELNPDVRGDFITEPVDTFTTKPDFLTPYTLVLVAAPIDPDLLGVIREHAQALQTPLFYFHCVGFYSHFSVQLPPAFPIVDTHPDPVSTSDLRLTKPWPALTAFAKEKTHKLDTLPAHDKGHIPYLLLLLHYLEQWRSTHASALPTSYAEKSTFRATVLAGAPDEENFAEAAAAVLKSLTPPTAPAPTLAIFAAPECHTLTAASPPFWLIARAIAAFHTAHAQLPLPGAVPDMKARSADYLALQGVYKQQARADVAEVLATVRSLETVTQRPPELAIDEREVEQFCKGAAHVHLVRGRPLLVVRRGERVRFNDTKQALAGRLADAESLMEVYIGFLAWDEFVATHGRVPGLSDADAPHDGEKLLRMAGRITDGLMAEAGMFVQGLERVCAELVRAAGSELHNTAALAGGLLAQEAIKVITRQYVPVDNTCLFDGIASRTGVLRV